ncbi:MAG TPA: DNRLRE domain-containing protein [Archangium sp.]|nr:DNRLRE domain-containing protein [Archangium sp.]
MRGIAAKRILAGRVAAAWVAAASVLGASGTQQAFASTLSFAPTADTYVQYDQPTTNFGSSVRWSVDGRTNLWRNALLRFNFNVPAGEEVVSAKVRAYSEAAATATEFVDIYTMTSSDWAESTVTWQNAPPRGTWLDKAGGYSTGAWVEWDVTKGVPSTGGWVNFKLETNALKWLGFKSRENTTPSLSPQLVIETAPVTTPPPTGDGTTAAATHGWGTPVARDEFNYTGAPDPAKWSVYDSAGHAGNGIRSPSQLAVDGSKLVITGTAEGTTGGMAAKFDRRKYGRWEVRMALPHGDNEYHGVSILWPDSENWPCDGEIDYAENLGDRSVMNFFHHYSCSNSQTSASRPVDTTQFHNYAVEWTASGIIGYLDGVKWFEDLDPSHLPPGPMHQTLQLDWFPDTTANGGAQMLVDWVRVYDVPSSPPPGGEAVTLAAVGDMNPDGNTSTSSPSGRNAALIISGLNDGSLDAFIGIGDFQYNKGYCNDLVTEWSKLWGQVIPKTYWTTGPNHDVEPGVNDDLDRFMNGQCSGSTARSAANVATGRFIDALDFYSFDLGNWHFAVLPTAAWRYDSTRAQNITAQLDTDLAAAKAAGKHLAAVYHDPYFTSSTSSHSRETDVKPWVEVLWKHRVRLTLSGSQHNYERSCPVNINDQCVSDGMTAFQVSTGGIGLRSFTSTPSYIVKRFSDTWGHLRLTLNPDGSFAWEFRPVSGGMQTDSGTRPAP